MAESRRRNNRSSTDLLAELHLDVGDARVCLSSAQPTALSWSQPRVSCAHRGTVLHCRFWGLSCPPMDASAMCWLGKMAQTISKCFFRCLYVLLFLILRTLVIQSWGSRHFCETNQVLLENSHWSIGGDGGVSHFLLAAHIWEFLPGGANTLLSVFPPQQ